MIIANENELLSEVCSTLPQVRRALVLAPHPDDEVFGCGGALCLLRETGVEIAQLVLTDGAFGGENTDGGLVAIREEESRAASRILGLPPPLFWKEPDRGLSYGEILIERLAKTIEEFDADLVFLPAPTELHPDHQVLAFAGAEALHRLGGKRQAVFYEVNTPLANPNLILDISLVSGKKQEAMRCFRSQLAEQPYDVRISGLNSYRAFHLGPQATSAEAFYLASTTDLGDALPALFAGASLHRQKQGLAVCGNDVPLVSIIVRSMDRPTLVEALDSIALQTWPNIEVVFVNAKGGEHRDPGDHCGRFPLRIINQGGARLLRSQAANVGLSACQGKFLGFLDDDDAIDPDHIHLLAVALQKVKGIAAAYAGVRGLRRNDPEQKEIACFAEAEANFAKLILGNFIPIHAVLFPAILLQQGICFDETLVIYEDWDFWLQVSRKTPFLFVDRVSATYFSGGDSGGGLDNTDNPETVRMATTYLIGKWLGRICPDEFMSISKLYHKTCSERHFAHLRIGEIQHDIAERDGHIASLNQTVVEQEQHIASLVVERAAIFASTSWHVTRPLRWVGHQVDSYKRLRKILSMLLQQGGGFTGIVAKCVNVFRREGFSGIRRRIMFAQTGRLVTTGGFSDKNDYCEWIRRYDTISNEIRDNILNRMENCVVKPHISLLLPTYNSNPEWLVGAIESVRGQLYPHWQLCIADDASTDPAIRTILERYAAEEPRISVTYREINGHISAASNSALGLATGEWIALLDHDDLLTEHALFWVVDAINRIPNLRLIYSDEDKIDGGGCRFAPYFKCDWNEDLFYSHNLVTHLGVYHAALVREIGGFQEGLEGAQDYDLALRCIERISPQQIHHIPRVLYHWRMHIESTAQSAGAKPYAVLAGETALNEHFKRLGLAAKAEVLDFGMYRVRYALPDKLPLVTLIIPTRNGLQLIRQCVESIIKKTTYPNYEILIIDNASDDPAILLYFKEIESEIKIRIVHDDCPFNYSALNNAAVKLARGELVGLLNNDLEVISPDWLSEMVSHALRPGIGAVGAKLWYPNDTSQHCGVVLGLGGIAGHSHKNLLKRQPGYFYRANLIQEMSAVTAACLVIRKGIYQEVGGLNEENLSVAFNDVDFCLRVREAGYRNVWTPYAELYHYESATRGAEDTPEKKARFAREVQYMKQRWGDLLLNDPAYSPNLTLDHEDFTLAWPPRVETVVEPNSGVCPGNTLNRVGKG